MHSSIRTIGCAVFLALGCPAYPQTPVSGTGLAPQPAVQNILSFISPDSNGQNDTTTVNGIRYIMVRPGMRWESPDTTGKTVYMHSFMAFPSRRPRIDSPVAVPRLP
ncbi:MAG: hypothetical protein ACOH13_00005 [Flavobacteriales bacterium]